MIGCGVASVSVPVLRRSLRVTVVVTSDFLIWWGLLMKRFLIAVAALLGATAAQAADMTAAPYAKAPAPVPATNWTGFYAGVNAGYGWGDHKATFAGGDPFIQELTSGPGFPPGTQIPSAAFNMKGATGGVQIGYNFQIAPQWVVGLETDFNGLDFSASAASAFRLGPMLGMSEVVGLVANEKADWFGTLRGRIGWLPADRLLVYGTGGLAYGQIKETLVFNGAPNSSAGSGGSNVGFQCSATGLGCFVGSSSRTAVGYAAGGGVEYAISRNVTLRAEYLYVNLGKTSTRASAVTPQIPYAPASFVAHFGDFDFNVVRAGLNYRF
jgi:outer membrane immunogenic protein